MELLFQIESCQSEHTSNNDFLVQGTSAQQQFDNSRFSFSPLGGIIGRSAECDWILDDPERRLSGKHAAITFENQQYFITDISTNGIYLNGNETPLGKGNSYPVNTGDRIAMGPYTVAVTIGEATNHHRSESNARYVENQTIDSLLMEHDPLDRLHGDNVDRSLSASMVGYEHLMSRGPDSQLDDALELPEPLPTWPAEPLPESLAEYTSASSADKPVLDQRLPNQTIPSNATMPLHNPDSGLAGNDFSKADNHYQAIQQFLRGVGLDEQLASRDDIGDLMCRFGELLKSYTHELMGLLGERSQYKNRCRLDMTLIAPVHNNPLKYCVNEVQALREMIIAPQVENLSGSSAIASAVTDIRDHFLRVERGYQGTLVSLIDYLSVGKRRSDPTIKVSEQRSNERKTSVDNPLDTHATTPWKYRKQVKQMRYRQQRLRDPSYYHNEFFAPRFAYYYQHPDQVNTTMAKAN